jgi:hypothetical protein
MAPIARMGGKTEFLQSARLEKFQVRLHYQIPAECHSAIQQFAKLRYRALRSRTIWLQGKITL